MKYHFDIVNRKEIKDVLHTSKDSLVNDLTEFEGYENEQTARANGITFINENKIDQTKYRVSTSKAEIVKHEELDIFESNND